MKKKNLPESFLSSTRNAKRVLVLDLGFLGDTIHLLPALWVIRQAYPLARLDVMVAEHIRSVLELTPWIDRVLGYPRYPKGPKWYQDFGRVRALRRERYDAVLNLNGSDRSSLLTFLTGAPFRLGRRPRGGGPPHWKYLFTHICDAPRGHMLHYRQNLAALQAAGFSPGDPEFHTVIPDSVNRSISDKLEGKTDFIHVSPFTNDDYKELPSGQLAEVLNQLNLSHPQSRVVLSCAPTPRERRKLETLRQQLQFQPWKYFEGTLSLPEFAALMGQCRLHLGGDSGALHVALLMGTPTVSWFRRYADINEWRPDGDPHQSVLGEASDQGLQGISSESILALLKQSLEPHL